uniref:Integrase catalytic domain-containing protein n=1 Tax=Strongyloides papillosus TaxID=174720 RepID=A0A0N5CHH8_STREA
VNFVSNARRRKKVIGYFSKRFKEWKKKPCALKIPLRRITMALNHYMDLLTGSRLTILCDHKPMSSFVKNSKCTKVMDILETINSFDIDIKYKNAASMKSADALSHQYVRRIVLTGNNKLITARSDNDTLMKIFKSFHYNIGYLDYCRTISLLKLRINYDGIATNYINYLKSCEKCMAVNNKLYKNKVNMKIVTIKLPSEIVCSDFLRALNGAMNKHKYLLYFYGYSMNYDGIATNYINYLKSYEKCMAVNNKLYKNKVDMKIVTIKLPSEIVCSDVLRALNGAMNEHKYLLYFTDTLSRFVCLSPLKTITDEEIWNKMLDNFIYVHGIPYTLLTDGATYYTSQYFTEAATNLGITLKVGNPYYHLDNCIAERQFRSIKKILWKKMALLTCQNAWDDFVPAIQFALNNIIYKSIKATSHQVFYGWKSLMPDEDLSNKSAEYIVDYIKDPISRKTVFDFVAKITKQQQGEKRSHGK